MARMSNKRRLEWSFFLCFGISSDRAVRFENDAQGVAVNYHVVSETVSRMREAPCCASIGAEWKEQIEADFQKRHHR